MKHAAVFLSDFGSMCEPMIYTGGQLAKITHMINKEKKESCLQWKLELLPKLGDVDHKCSYKLTLFSLPLFNLLLSPSWSGLHCAIPLLVPSRRNQQG